MKLTGLSWARHAVWMGKQELHVGLWYGNCLENAELESHGKNDTVKPVLNGIPRVQNIFPLKPGFRLIKVYYNN
jgi:hypothetical protein